MPDLNNSPVAPVAHSKEQEVTGEAAGGLVKVTMDGRHAVRKVSIDPSLMDDREMLEDIVAAAANDAVNRLATANEQRMGELKPQELANRAWTFVTAGQSDAHLLMALARLAEQRTDEFDSQNFANTA